MSKKVILNFKYLKMCNTHYVRLKPEYCFGYSAEFGRYQCLIVTVVIFKYSNVNNTYRKS